MPAGLKDAFNALTPDKDATIPAVVERVTDPELPKLIEGIYGVPAPATPAQRPGRDLPDRHRQERADARRLGPIQADLNSQLLNADVNAAQFQPSEMLRLNTRACQPTAAAEPARRARRRPAGLPERPPARRRRRRHLAAGRRGCRADRQARRRARRRRQGGRQRRRRSATQFPYVALPGNVTAADSRGAHAGQRRRAAARLSGRSSERCASGSGGTAGRGAETTRRSRCSRRRASSAWPTTCGAGGWPRGLGAVVFAGAVAMLGSAAAAPRSGANRAAFARGDSTETG